MAHVLAVGIATLDIINEVECYPEEDAEVRALSQTVRRGGNATNTLVALNQLGHRCEWAGVCVDGPDAGPILSDLEKNGIGTRHCQLLKRGKVPTSYITLSRSGASRTIIHYRDLPEFDYRSFSRIPLEEFDWIHFEGRNVEETLRMMQRVWRLHPRPPVSLEVEKPREGIQSMFNRADLILFSPNMAKHYGHTVPVMLEQMHVLAPHAEMVCTLGAEGAVALDRAGRLIRNAAYPPHQLVDTIAAGDVFNAGMIDASVRGSPLHEALRFACELAGNKCGQAGLDGLQIPDRRVDT